MKSKDLKVGEEFAYMRWMHRGPVGSHAALRVVVEKPPMNGYVSVTFPSSEPGKAGTPRLVETRSIVATWAEYVTAREEHKRSKEAAQRQMEAEEAQRKNLAKAIEESMGLPAGTVVVHTWGQSVSINKAELLKLLNISEGA